MSGNSFGNRLSLISQQLLSDRLEYTKIMYLFGYLLFIVSASTIGRTAADTLFLSRYDATALSYMYLPQAATLLVVGFIYQKLCGRFRTDKLVIGVIILASTLALTSRIIIGFGYIWIFPVIYIGYDALNFLMIVCFWQFATSVMDQRKAKRTIGWVGSGGIVGGILSGFGLKLLVQPLGTENLIFIYAGAQLLCLLFVLILLRGVTNRTEVFASKPASKKSPRARSAGNEAKQGLFHNVPHLKYVAIMAATLVISLTLIDYQFKVIMRSVLQNDELASFMGSFYGFAGLLALFIQLFVSGKLITRYGVMTAILVFPIILLTGSLTLLLVPVLAVATAVKASDKVLGDTIYSSVSQLIMFPIPPEWRGRAKGFLDGIVRNGAKGLAAISLIVLSQWFTVEQFSYFILALIGCCIFAAFRIKKPYLAMLLSTLKSNSMNTDDELDFVDPASIRMLVSALQSTNKKEVLYAFSILKDIQEFDMSLHIEQLLHHSVHEIRIQALNFIQATTPRGGEIMLAPLLEAEEIDIRAHTILALCAYALEERLDQVVGYLQEHDVQLRSAAIAGLIKYYGIEGMFHAVGTLKQLLESDNELERTAMASLFGQIGITSFYKPLIPMLVDPSYRVRICALESTALLCVPELVPYVIPLIKDSQTRQKAIVALKSYDEAIIIPLLESYLVSEEIHIHLPRVLELIGTQAALDALLRHYLQFPSELREKALDSAVRINMGSSKVQKAHAELLIIHEIADYWEWVEHSKVITSLTDTQLVRAVEEMRIRHLKRIFQLLSLLYDTNTIQAVYSNWSTGNARQQANAAEVIDQLLTGNLRSEMTRIISPLPIVSKEASSSILIDESLNWFYTYKDKWINHIIDYLRASAAQRSLDMVMRQTELLQRVSLFSSLTGRDIFNLAQHLKPVHMSKGAEIVREMDNGQSLFLIEQGSTGVYVNTNLVTTLGAYDCFGEMSVITSRLRSATVIAEEDVVVYELTSASFYEVIFDRTEIAIEIMKQLSLQLRTTNEKVVAPMSKASQELADEIVHTTSMEVATGTQHIEENSHNLEALHEAGRNEIIIRRILVLQKISLFAHCSQEDFVKLAHMVEESVYEPGEKICSVGEDGDTMYGIIDGMVQVHADSEKLATLSVGQYFGEMAIIDGQPRSADCTAINRTILLELTREQVFAFCFQQMHVLKGLMRVLAERTQDTKRAQ